MPPTYSQTLNKKRGSGHGLNGPRFRPGAAKPVQRQKSSALLAGAKRDVKEDEEKLLQKHKETKVVKQTESSRLQDFRRKQYAAMRIQKAWRNHKMRSFAILLTAKQAVHKLRLRQGAEEFHKQIAALTIQLAWRKFIRKKLLQSLHPNKRQLRMWDPELIAMKQRALVSQVYGEQLAAPFWHPNMLRQQRPYWAKLAPSSAAISSSAGSRRKRVN